ncbi:hypothetical protein CXIVA_12530 [Clostridium sp. SY8519]|nr:hypothetical protein CXIVA_12530 [Clostridium sp. SY8519]
MFEPKGRVRAGAWAKKRMQRAENTACFHTHLIKTERTVEMYEWVANDYLTVSCNLFPGCRYFLYTQKFVNITMYQYIT